jgi:hypothetical protein
METQINKWYVKGKAEKFSREWFGYLLHLIGSSPACIMGFENTGSPYSYRVYERVKDRHPDIKHGEISVKNGKIIGFTEECVQNRKIVIITENPRDRGAVYASDIVKEYDRLKYELNIKGLTFITVERNDQQYKGMNFYPQIFEAEQIRRNRFLL